VHVAGRAHRVGVHYHQVVASFASEGIKATDDDAEHARHMIAGDATGYKSHGNCATNISQRNEKAVYRL